MSGKIVGAAWVPGLPFLLHPEKSPKWRELSQAMDAVSTHIGELKPDVLVIYSTQWLSVLGTSFQVQMNPKGTHVDENWYEWGDLDFDFKTEPALGRAFATEVAKQGVPTRTVDFEEFPIDTGTLVALRLLNGKKKLPVSVLSSWVYADPETSQKIGEAITSAIEKSGKRVFVLTSSLLSTRFFTDEINPLEDKIVSTTDDAWNRKITTAFESGNLSKYKTVATEFARACPVDMQLSGFHWLSGVLRSGNWSGQVLAYGPLWGTGAVVAEFRPNK